MNENNIAHEINVLEKNIVKLMVPRNSRGFFSQQFGISEEIIEEQDIPCSRIILDDDSKWVILMDDPSMRMKGYFYLKNALEKYKFNHLNVAKNAIIYVNKRTFLLSEHVGEEKVVFTNLTLEQGLEFYDLEFEIGYHDLYAGDQLYSRNLRIINDRIFIFDAELCQFTATWTTATTKYFTISTKKQC